MDKLYNLKEKLCAELDEYARKQDMGAGDLEVIHKLTDTIKNIDKICMLEDEGNYSNAGEWQADMRGNYGRGSSYANRGQHYVRGHYSRDDGRSQMMEHLEMALDSANEQDREDIKRFMRKLESV